ncbi:MAG: hypothetical protein DWH91_12145 [Planctomycetota bacterium]|nr:MAG: hypothetical protein DWH91_12145 [Planctomycetota bacterium]
MVWAVRVEWRQSEKAVVTRSSLIADQFSGISASVAQDDPPQLFRFPEWLGIGDLRKSIFRLSV